MIRFSIYILYSTVAVRPGPSGVRGGGGGGGGWTGQVGSSLQAVCSQVWPCSSVVSRNTHLPACSVLNYSICEKKYWPMCELWTLLSLLSTETGERSTEFCFVLVSIEICTCTVQRSLGTPSGQFRASYPKRRYSPRQNENLNSCPLVPGTLLGQNFAKTCWLCFLW